MKNSKTTGNLVYKIVKSKETQYSQFLIIWNDKTVKNNIVICL